MGRSGKLLGLDKLRSLGLHFAKRQFCIFLVVCTHCINYNGDFFTSLEQSKCSHLNGTFEAGTDQNELIGAHFAQQPVNSGLIERVNATLM